MRRFGFLIAATLLVGLLWGGVAEICDRIGIQVWWQARMEASDHSSHAKASNEEH